MIVNVLERAEAGQAGIAMHSSPVYKHDLRLS